METKTAIRQRDRRYPIFRPHKAFVEFGHAGREWRLPLLDISVAGIAFTVDEEVPGLTAGLKLDKVAVRVSECEMRGALVIRHATPRPDWTTHYGAIFYPAEESDMHRLNGVLAGVDAVQTL